MKLMTVHSLVAILTLSVSIPGVLAAINSPPSDVETLKKTCAGIATNLIANYKPNYRGAVPDIGSAGIESRQWWESGVMWGAFGEYARYTKDLQFVPIVTNALSNGSISNTQVNSKEVGSFLGADQRLGATLLGRWNDDIAWYGLATLTFAELTGKTALLPRSKTISYLQVAINTYDEIMQQHDPTTCGGGIFWSRDRTRADTKDYKSVITNVQMMVHSAKLGIITGDPKYMATADTLYKWLQTSGLITPDFHVLDGLSIAGCVKDAREFSYNAGLLLGGLAYMHKASGNIQYLNDAVKYLPATIAIYSKGNILQDLCEGGTGPCTEGTSTSRTPATNQVPYKTALIRGLMYVYVITTDQKTKATIKTLFDASWDSMMKNCNAATYDCSAWWLSGAPAAVPNFHHQIVALELANAMAAVYINPNPFNDAPITNPTTDVQKAIQNSGAFSDSIYAYSFLGVSVITTMVVVSLF
ncbi:hypothetical protein MT418_007711 [Batrachochytrium dendrobatidis]